MRSKARWSMCFLMIHVLMALPFSTAIADVETNMAFSAEPGPRSSLSQEGGYFSYRLRPGDEAKGSVLVTNTSLAQSSTRLAVVGADTGLLGGVDYGLPGQKPIGTDAWIQVAADELILEPSQSTEVGFSISVPQDAGAGVHLAGIAIWEPRQGRAALERPDSKDATAVVSVQTRRVIAVQIIVPGPRAARLEIAGAAPVARPDGAYLEIRIANAGNDLTKASGTLSVPALDLERDFSVETFVPGTDIAYPVRLGRSLADGEYEAEITLQYDGTGVSWEGVFAVGGELTAGLVEHGAIGEQRALPWVALAGIAILMTVGVLVVMWRRNRNGRRQAAPAPNRSRRRYAPPPPPPQRTSRQAPPPPPPLLQPQTNRR